MGLPTHGPHRGRPIPDWVWLVVMVLAVLAVVGGQAVLYTWLGGV